MKPQLFNTDAWDSKKGNVVSFLWDGNQSMGNICTICDNITGEIVYQEMITTMQLKHEIPPNKLVNSKTYNLRIQTVDINNNVSEMSDAIVFQCLDTPSFTFDNLNGVIRNSSFKVTMSYSQTQNEPIQCWSIDLYDQSKSLIDSSGVMYSNSISYILQNLEDNKNYYLKAYCITLHGMEVHTDYMPFSVEYIRPALYSILSLENIKNDGFIKIQSNIKSLECKSEKNPVSYVGDEFVDARDNTIFIDDDFALDDDYIIKLSGYGFKPNTLLMQLSDRKRNIKMNYRIGCYDVNNNIDRVYIELLVPVGITHMIIYSNYIEVPNENDLLDIKIKYFRGLYNVYLENRGA